MFFSLPIITCIYRNYHLHLGNYYIQISTYLRILINSYILLNKILYTKDNGFKKGIFVFIVTLPYC